LFTLTGFLGTARYSHTATLLPSGKVLIVGGDCNSYSLSSAELFDPKNATFAPTGTMAEAREAHTATLLPNGQVLIAGGVTNSGGYEALLSSAELYDPVAGTFTSTGYMTETRCYHTATLLQNGNVLFVGACLNRSSSAELYDPTSGAFSATGSMMQLRAGGVTTTVSTATLLPDGQVLIAGGDTGNGNAHQLSEAELYDPASGGFTPTGAMAEARTGHTATLLPNSKVLVAGGSDTPSNQNKLPSAELYDSASGGFSATGAMVVDRSGHTATLLPNGRVLLAGGLVPLPGGTISSAELYDPAKGSFTAANAMTTARQDHTATLLLNGKVLIAGGDTGSSNAMSSAELYY
jgi:hypothetical protein